MGSSESKTHKLTVDNDDPTSVIKVSEDVVDRIKGNQVVRQKLEGAPAVSAFGTPVGPFVSQPLYMCEPSLTSIQLRQANVAELKKNDDYWKNRLCSLEENNKRVEEIMNEECCRALGEFHLKKTSKLNFNVPCQDKKLAVMECYKQYPNQTMKCSKLVQQFQECVDCNRDFVVKT